MVFNQPLLVTGIRVLDLICPMQLGGTLAINGDAGSGVNVLSMETMQNLCRRYRAKATIKFTVAAPFTQLNVTEWIGKLNVAGCVHGVELGARAEISVADPARVIATLRPFTDRSEDADAWVVLRRSLFEAGRLPAVELGASGSNSRQPILIGWLIA